MGASTTCLERARELSLRASNLHVLFFDVVLELADENASCLCFADLHLSCKCSVMTASDVFLGSSSLR